MSEIADEYGDLPWAARDTIYGNYAADAITTTGYPWHIEGTVGGTTLCGRPLGNGAPRRMRLHVALLECSACMSLGGER